MSILDSVSNQRQNIRFADGIAKTVFYGSHFFMAVSGVNFPKVARVAELALSFRIYVTTTGEFLHQTNRFNYRIGKEKQVSQLNKYERVSFALGYALMGTVLTSGVLSVLNQMGLKYSRFSSITNQLLSKQFVLFSGMEFVAAAGSWKYEDGKPSDLLAASGEFLCHLMGQGVIRGVPMLQYGGGLIAGAHKIWNNPPKTKQS